MTEPHPKFITCRSCNRQVPIINFFWAKCSCGIEYRLH